MVSVLSPQLHSLASPACSGEVPAAFSGRHKNRESPAAPSMQLLSRSCLSITGILLEKVVDRKKKKIWQGERFIDKHFL